MPKIDCPGPEIVSVLFVLIVHALCIIEIFSNNLGHNGAGQSPWRHVSLRWSWEKLYSWHTYRWVPWNTYILDNAELQYEMQLWYIFTSFMLWYVLYYFLKSLQEDKIQEIMQVYSFLVIIVACH